MAVNDDLADDAIMRSIRATRAGNGVWKEVLALLKRSERDLIDKVADMGNARSIQSVRAKQLLKEVRQIIDGGAEAFNRELEKSGKTLVEVEETAALKSFESRVPVAINWVRPPAVLLEAAVLSQPFEGAILKDHIAKWSADTIFKMQGEIRTAIVQGEGIEPMQRRLRRVADIKIKDARTIARTYTAHVTNEARAAVYQANADVIAKEQWVATLDNRTCPICGKLDNKTFPVGKGTRAPVHMNCRCVRIPITKSAEALQKQGKIGKRAARDADGMTGTVPADMSYPEWLQRQPEATQIEVLGPARYEMFKKGTKFDKFVNDENEIIPLSELRDL